MLSLAHQGALHRHARRRSTHIVVPRVAGPWELHGESLHTHIRHVARAREELGLPSRAHVPGHGAVQLHSLRARHTARCGLDEGWLLVPTPTMPRPPRPASTLPEMLVILTGCCTK